MTLRADQDIEVQQATMPDAIRAPFTHQTIMVKGVNVSDRMMLSTKLAVNTSITK